MARFRGTLQGNRGQASRLGTEKTGLSVTANGWHTGVSVQLDADPDNPGKDRVLIWRTGGSGGPKTPKEAKECKLIGEWSV